MLRQVEYPGTGTRRSFRIPWHYETPSDLMVILRDPKGGREHALDLNHHYTLAGPDITLQRAPVYGARVLVLFQGKRVEPWREIAIAPVVESVPPIAPGAVVLGGTAMEPEAGPTYDEENDPVLRDDLTNLARIVETLAQQQQAAAAARDRIEAATRAWQMQIEDRLARLEAVLLVLGEEAERLAKEPHA